jgi:hypothetical protein
LKKEIKCDEIRWYNKDHILREKNLTIFLNAYTISKTVDISGMTVWINVSLIRIDAYIHLRTSIVK